MVSEITTKKQVHDEVQVLGILESVMRVNDKLRTDHREQLELIHDRLNTFLVHYSSFKHLFHSKLSDFLSLKSVAAYSPHLAKASATNSVLVIEQVFVESCNKKR